MRSICILEISLIFIIAISSGTAIAGPTGAEKCEAAKNKEAGKYALCRGKTKAKAIKKGEAPDYMKCNLKLGKKWLTAELPGACIDSITDGDILGFVTDHADAVATALAGGVLPSGCGNGTIEAGEDCDFGDLAGETCTSQLGPEALGTLACAPGACTFDTSGCLPHFEDTGSTIIDHQTGLEWEKKTGTVGGPSFCPGGASCGDPHNVNNVYTWSDSFTAFDGGTQTLFLDVLNDVAGGGTGCFAGHCDWRMPSSGGNYGIGPVQPAELESIFDCSGGAPCVDPAFGPTVSDGYWSSSTRADEPDLVWGPDFFDGSVAQSYKTLVGYVRAVRGGL